MRGYLIQDQMALLADPKIQEAAEKEWNQWKEYLQLEEKEPESVVDERQKSPDSEPTTAPPPAPRVLLASSSDEEQPKSDGNDDVANDSIPQKFRWMYEPDYRQEKPKEETPEEKEKRMQAREVRRIRTKNREERLKELERLSAEPTNPEDYDSDVVTDVEVEVKEESVSSEVPRMILIEIDNVRLLYPSKFICITVEEDRQVLESMGLKTHPPPQELQGNQ